MGAVLTVLYLLVYYLTPAFLFGAFAEYRIEAFLLGLAILVSPIALMKTFALKTSQAWALMGLTLAAMLSAVFGRHWLGGSISAFLELLPNALVYFLVCIHFKSKKRLQLLILGLMLVCMFVVTRGLWDLQRGVPENVLAPGTALGDPFQGGKTGSPYFLRYYDGNGGWSHRLQGLGVINDPNDFGQLLVCVIPLTFFFWEKKSALKNLLIVILPICVMVVGIYFTHSRGALLALLAITILAFSRKIGTIPSLILGACLFFAATALQFTGGRDISASAGEDRTSLWGQGMDAFKTHPIFGVGLSQLPDYTDNHRTAHNSIIVCVAELGIIGLFFWSMFLFATLNDALFIASPKKLTAGVPMNADVGPFPDLTPRMDELEKDEINRLGRAGFLSLFGFLFAGVFLSRAFVITLFMLGALVESLYQMALNREMAPPRRSMKKVLSGSAAMAVGLLVIMYLLVRILNFFH